MRPEPPVLPVLPVLHVQSAHLRLGIVVVRLGQVNTLENLENHEKSASGIPVKQGWETGGKLAIQLTR